MVQYPKLVGYLMFDLYIWPFKTLPKWNILWKAVIVPSRTMLPPKIVWLDPPTSSQCYLPKLFDCTLQSPPTLVTSQTISPPKIFNLHSLTSSHTCPLPNNFTSQKLFDCTVPPPHTLVPSETMLPPKIFRLHPPTSSHTVTSQNCLIAPYQLFPDLSPPTKGTSQTILTLFICMYWPFRFLQISIMDNKGIKRRSVTRSVTKNETKKQKLLVSVFII